MKEEWSFASPQVKSSACLFMQGVHKYMCLCLWQKIKNLHSPAAVLAPRSKLLPNRSATYTFSLVHAASKLSLWCPSWDSVEGRKLCFFFCIRAGRTQQSQGPVRGGCLTGHNRYKSSGGSPCQLQFPGGNRCRYMNTWTPPTLSSLPKVDLRVEAPCCSDPQTSHRTEHSRPNRYLV